MYIDKARSKTDKELANMEKHLRNMYRQAEEDLTEKWNAYMQAGQERLSNLYDAYINAPAGQKREAKKQYQEALKNYTLQDKYYKDMVDDVTYRLAHINELAVSYTNDKMPGIYAINYNQIDPDAIKLGVRYDLVNEQAVKYMSKKSLNYSKDRAWNMRKINNAVLQGIIQGESIDDIAKRLMPILDYNKASAIRNARTMTTEAENRGRLDRYEDYVSQGIIMKKVWIATGDDRTRDWHLELDGQEVDPDEKFIDSLGNELDCPGDESCGAPETYYNCRCAMRTHIIGRYRDDGTIKYMPDHRTEMTRHEKEIDAEMRSRGL